MDLYAKIVAFGVLMVLIVFAIAYCLQEEPEDDEYEAWA